MSDTDINPKQIKVLHVSKTYDLLNSHYATADVEIPQDMDAASYARSCLTEVLRDIGYPRTDNVGDILTQHDAAVKNGKKKRATSADADEIVQEMFRRVSGRDLTVDEAQQPQAAAADDETPTAAAAEDADTTSTEEQKATEMKDTATRSAATGYSIADNASQMIDPLVESVTGKMATSLGDIVSALELAEHERTVAREVIDGYDAVITAFKAGEEDVDTSDLGDLGKFAPSGYADLPTEHPMMAILDTQIAAGVTPATTFAQIIETLRETETDVTRMHTELRDRKRELRRVQPKTARKVEGVAPVSAAADTLNEIDEINADCAIVEELAADLFPGVYGTNPDILKFDVPRMDFGVEHPEVPRRDETFRFHTRVLSEALHAISENEIIWLHGHSGCGKSDFWAQVAAALNMPFTRLNLDSHLVRADIVGGLNVVSDGQGGTVTKFLEGALPRAMARPGLLLLDEFDCGDPEIMPIFQPILEGKDLVLLEDGGRIVRRHPQFRIAITGNSTGFGSDDQMYLNVHEQSAATRDRISAYVEMNYMPADIEKSVVMARNPDADEDFVEKLIQLAGRVRDGYRKGEVHSLFSTRAVLSCTKRYTRFAPLYPTPEEAVNDILETVIMGRMDPASVNVVRGLIDNIFTS